MNSSQGDNHRSIKKHSKRLVSKRQPVSKKITIPMNQVLTIKTMTTLNSQQIKRELIKDPKNHPKIQMLLLAKAQGVKL